MPNRTFHFKGDFMPRKSKSKQPVKDTEAAATRAAVEATPDTSAGPQADIPVEPQPLTAAKPVSSLVTFQERIAMPTPASPGVPSCRQGR
jgi:uncharacterized lipoprotein YbaY